MRSQVSINVQLLIVNCSARLGQSPDLIFATRSHQRVGVIPPNGWFRR
jgi:hypothetical protein